MEGSLLVLDRDPEAIAAPKAHGSRPASQCHEDTIRRLGERSVWCDCLARWMAFCSILVSSPQLDNPERGFSFMRDGPLDMRMDSEAKLSAAEWLADAPEQKIADVIYQLARALFKKDSPGDWKVRTDMAITRTVNLQILSNRPIPPGKAQHPATRTFQAIRMHINNELSELESHWRLFSVV